MGGWRESARLKQSVLRGCVPPLVTSTDHVMLASICIAEGVTAIRSKARKALTAQGASSQGDERTRAQPGAV